MRLNQEWVIFTRCAQKLSFIDAAASLGLTASAVGKAVSRLEEYYAVKLFSRNTRSMSLTEEGKVLLTHSANILREMEELKRAFQKPTDEISGGLKISIPNVGTAFCQIISAFTRAYPHIRLEVFLSDEQVDLVTDGYDAVIRFGNASDSRMVAKKIGVTYMDIVHSPLYKVEKALERNNLLLYKYPSSGKIEQWPEPFNKTLVENNQGVSLTVNSVELIKTLCVKGDGLACLPDCVTRELVNSGELSVYYSDRVNAREVNIIWPYHKVIQPKMRAFIDFFTANFQT